MRSPCFWQGFFFKRALLFSLHSPQKKLFLSYMKKLFLSFGVVVSAISFGQRFGLKAGVNIASNSISEKEFNAIPYYLADAAQPTVQKGSLLDFMLALFTIYRLGINFLFSRKFYTPIMG